MWNKLKSILKKKDLDHPLPLLVNQGVTDSILGDLSPDDFRDLGIDKLRESNRLLAAFHDAQGGESVPVEMVVVEGGILPNSSQLANTQVATFEIGKYAVTFEQWQTVRSWSILARFNIDAGEAAVARHQWTFEKEPGGARHPVTKVNWFDCLKWCNAKSLMEGLDPVYGVKENDDCYRKGESWSDGAVLNPKANGYRLPTEAEWEWAARGGRNSQGYTFAGSNDRDAAGWYDWNSREAAYAVGQKVANELGLYDMSGNVFEWCRDCADPAFRRFRGGSWNAGYDYCTVAHRGSYDFPDCRRFDLGLRLARNVP